MEKSVENWLSKQQRALKFNKSDEKSHRDKINRIHLGCDLKMLSACDLIIESISEDHRLKVQLFQELNAIVKPEAIFSTNTSSIPIPSLVTTENRSDRFIGLHFFYPSRLKNLVEVNFLKSTSKETKECIENFLKMLGKFHVFLSEQNHFLFNRLFLQLQAGIFRLHAEENHSVEVLDDLVRSKLFPIGVFEFFDHIGIDLMLTSITNYTNCLSDKEFYRPLLEGLKILKDKNQPGMKTYKGFYTHSKSKTKIDEQLIGAINDSDMERLMNKIYGWYLTPVFESVANRILTPFEADYIVKEYIGSHQGPLELAMEIGFVPKK